VAVSQNVLTPHHTDLPDKATQLNTDTAVPQCTDTLSLTPHKLSPARTSNTL